MKQGLCPCCLLALLFLTNLDSPFWIDPLITVPHARPEKIGAVR